MLQYNAGGCLSESKSGGLPFIRSACAACAPVQRWLVLIDFSAFVVVDTALRSPAVCGFVCENCVFSAELAASNVLVHTAGKVVGYTDIHGGLGFGIENAVFALGCGNLADIGGTERRDLDRSAGLVKRHNIIPF